MDHPHFLSHYITYFYTDAYFREHGQLNTKKKKKNVGLFFFSQHREGKRESSSRRFVSHGNDL